MPRQSWDFYNSHQTCDSSITWNGNHRREITPLANSSRKTLDQWSVFAHRARISLLICSSSHVCCVIELLRMFKTPKGVWRDVSKLIFTWTVWKSNQAREGPHELCQAHLDWVSHYSIWHTSCFRTKFSARTALWLCALNETGFTPFGERCGFIVQF